jgi:hypothetical protein
MAEQSEAKREWREATPDDSDKGSSSDGSGLDESMSYESKELTLRSVKKVHGEEEDDPDFDQMEEAKGCGKQPLDEDARTLRLEVLAHQ